MKELDRQLDAQLEIASAVWDQMTHYPFYKVFVALKEGEVIGTFSLLVADNLAHAGRRVAIVENVVVGSAHRGKGIGKRMMDRALTLAQQEKCYKLMLSSNQKREKAHRFYNGLGFDRHGISFSVEWGAR